ncbi:hypothetical protein FB451DRAFT_1125592, partial [Mycena latifolia]
MKTRLQGPPGLRRAISSSTTKQSRPRTVVVVDSSSSSESEEERPPKRRARRTIVVVDSSSSSESEDERPPKRLARDDWFDLSVRDIQDFHSDQAATSSSFTDFLEFCTGSKLHGLLTLQHSKELFHAMRHSAADTDCSNIAKCMSHLLSTFPKNLARYTQVVMLQRFDGGSMKLQELTNRWISWDSLECVVNYQSIIQPTLLGFLKQSCNISTTNHAISKNAHTHLKHDVTVVVAQLILILRDSKSHKRFLACREMEAQHLLDLLQDVLDCDGFSVVRSSIFKALLRLSRASGLHPKCFPLSGLQKVGQQVAGGGFGDIWKGLINGQTVAVKMMRIFQDRKIESALKEFSREALIWRQLCHPNLLPFFGLYYLENRLCLVSPWMENGNILEFLSEAPHGVDRLSLNQSGFMQGRKITDAIYLAMEVVE